MGQHRRPGVSIAAAARRLNRTVPDVERMIRDGEIESQTSQNGTRTVALIGHRPGDHSSISRYVAAPPAAGAAPLGRRDVDPPARGDRSWTGAATRGG
jgi:hypothetical protein